MILTHYNLFISSTFIDMDVERDIVKFEVIPALNQMFNKRGVNIQAIDLRYGINTSGLSEDEASDKVLNVCMKSIDRARPFFIGFVGNRYGWIPSPERWQDFYSQLDGEQKAILRESTGMSITEMEILYSGLFFDDSSKNRYLFFIRDCISNEDIPKTYRPYYEMEGIDSQRKNQELRTKIRNRCDVVSNSRCYSYRINSDKNNNLCAPGLAKILIDGIAEQIETELMEKDIIPDNRPVWIVEGDEVWGRMCSLADQTVMRPEMDRFMPTNGSTIICGGPSSGKSTMLAQLCLKYFYEDQEQENGARKILLYAAINRSSYSRSIFQIMGRWVIELASLLNVPQNDKLKQALVDAEPMHHTTIQEMFYEAVDMVRDAGHSVHIFIDDLDQFLLSSPGDEGLDWVDDRVTVYATVSFENLSVVSNSLSFPFGIVQLFDLVEGDSFVRSIQHRSFCDLPLSICEHFANLEYTFLEINILFKMVRLFNKDDYRQMRRAASFEDTKVYELFESLPRDYIKLLDYFAMFYTNRVGSREKYSKLIQLLNNHPSGLRTCELIGLMNGEVTVEEVYRMLFYFDDFIDIEYDTGILKLKHHPSLYSNEVLSEMRTEKIMMEQASQYLIREAMHTMCNQIGVEVPNDIKSTIVFTQLYSDSIIGSSLKTFVVNAYLSILYENAHDIENAIHYSDKALLVATSMGDSMIICQGHVYWAKAMILKNANSIKAKEAGKKALDIFEQNNIIYEDLPDLYLLVGFLSEEDGEKEEAVRFYKCALRIMKTMKGSNYYGDETIDNLSHHINLMLS